MVAACENHHPGDAWLHRDAKGTKPRHAGFTRSPAAFPEAREFRHFFPSVKTHFGTCVSFSTGHQPATSHVFTVALNGTHFPVSTPAGVRRAEVHRGSPRLYLCEAEGGSLATAACAINLELFQVWDLDRVQKIGIGGKWVPESRAHLLFCQLRGWGEAKSQHRARSGTASGMRTTGDCRGGPGTSIWTRVT